MAKIFSICLHRVSDEYSPAYPPMPVRVFEKLMIYLKKRNGFLSLEDLNNVEKREKGGILLTFDDAYHDFYQNAYPILKKLDIPVVLNVITSCAETGGSFWTQRLNNLVEAFFKEGRVAELNEMSFCNYQSVVIRNEIEKTALNIFKILLDDSKKDAAIKEMTDKLGYSPADTRMMNWDEIREVYQHGVVIGSHTHKHKNLTLIQKEFLIEELNDSADLIEKNIGRKPEVIAFPNGIYNQETLEVSSSLNYRYAMTVDNSSFSYEPDQKDISVIPRIIVYNQTFLKNWFKLRYYFAFK